MWRKIVKVEETRENDENYNLAENKLNRKLN